MNIVSIYKVLVWKSTQTFSANHRNLLLTVNQKQPTDIKNVTLFAKLFFLQQKIKRQRTLTNTGFTNVPSRLKNVTPV